MGDYDSRLQRIKRHIPTLFTEPGEVLYVGARPARSDYIQELFNVGHEITVIEAFYANYEALESDSRIAHLVYLDLHNLSAMGWEPRKFDYSIWWHGAEHSTYASAPGCIQALERVTAKTVILGTPLGKVKQGSAYDNPFERHLSFWTPEMFWELGYQTDVLGEKDVLGCNILAWKEIG